MGANELSCEISYDAENFEAAYAAAFEKKAPFVQAKLTGRLIQLPPRPAPVAPRPSITGQEVRETVRRKEAAKAELNRAERALTQAEARLELQREPLDAELEAVAPCLRRTPAGKHLLAKAGNRSTWKRATLIVEALRLDSHDVRFDEREHLENAHALMASAQVEHEQAKQQQRLAVAAYLGEIARLRWEINLLWTSCQSAFMPRQAA